MAQDKWCLVCGFEDFFFYLYLYREMIQFDEYVSGGLKPPMSNQLRCCILGGCI